MLVSVFFKTLHGHFNYLLKIYELSYRGLANNCAALKIVKKKKKKERKIEKKIEKTKIEKKKKKTSRGMKN